MGGGGGGSIYNPSNRPKTDLGGSGGGDTNGEKSCLEISFQTNLASPDPDVLPKISEGYILNVILETKDGPLVAIFEGEIAGSINHYLYKDVKDCIENGHTFVAKVLDISSGNCQVLVYCTE